LFFWLTPRVIKKKRHKKSSTKTNLVELFGKPSCRNYKPPVEYQCSCSRNCAI